MKILAVLLMVLASLAFAPSADAGVGDGEGGYLLVDAIPDDIPIWVVEERGQWCADQYWPGIVVCAPWVRGDSHFVVNS